MPDVPTERPRLRYPVLMWIIGAAITTLGSLAALYVAANFQSFINTNPNGGLQLALFGVGFSLVGLLMLRDAFRIHRIVARVRSGRCVACGIDRGGRFDTPCPACYPHGDPNFPAPNASPEEVEGWLTRQPRNLRRRLSGGAFESRWIDISQRNSPLSTITPETTPDGGLVFTDRARMTLPIVACGILLAASIGLGVCTYLYLSSSISIVGIGFTVAAIAVFASLPLPFLICTLLGIRSRRGRVRVLTLSPADDTATDELTTPRGVEQADAPLDTVRITISNLRGGPCGNNPPLLGLIIWAPRGPLLIAAAQSEAKLVSILETLPPWLRDQEAHDPATVIIRRRPRPTVNPSPSTTPQMA